MENIVETPVLETRKTSDVISVKENDSSVENSGSSSTLSVHLDGHSSPVFGNVCIANSKQVHLGDNTYFNGPVTIKQIIDPKSGFCIDSYIKACNESKLAHENKFSNLKKPDEGFLIQNWRKVALVSAGALVALAVIIAVLFTYNSGINKEAAYYANSSTATNDTMIISPNKLWIVSRTEWVAQPPLQPLDKLNLPVPLVIVAHTATESCNTQSTCVLQVRYIQMFHIESKNWSDIAYNFLIGGDGYIYYGRGWDYQGAHTFGYNSQSIGIAFIGTYINEDPLPRQFDALKRLIDEGVQLGKISKDYKLLAHRQLRSTESPGDKVVNVIQNWPHYVQNQKDFVNATH